MNSSLSQRPIAKTRFLKFKQKKLILDKKANFQSTRRDQKAGSSDFLSSGSVSVASLFAGLFREEELVDAGFEAALGNLDRGHQLHQLLVIPDCLADVLWLDGGLLRLSCLVASDFEYFTN